MQYSEKWKTAVAFTLQNEGGYSNDPNDPGGETKFGISKRSFPDLDIKNLYPEKAEALYYKYFWTPLRLDEIEDTQLAAKIFDTAVHLGLSSAVKILQMAVNLCPRPADGPGPLIIDGRLGPLTIAAANAVPSVHVLASFMAHLKRHYEKLIAKYPALERYRIGWMGRATALP